MYILDFVMPSNADSPESSNWVLRTVFPGEDFAVALRVLLSPADA